MSDEKINIYESIIHAQNAYIKLLEHELGNLTVLAGVHGYKCSQDKIDAGRICRGAIIKAKEELCATKK